MVGHVEVRVPFLDHSLLEFCASLPESARRESFDQKKILRDAVAPWLPPSIILTVPGNAQASDGTQFSRFHLLALPVFIAILAVLHLAFECLRVDRNLRFFLYFFLCSATLVLGKLWGNVSFVPQPHRFQTEMEMAAIGAVLFPLAKYWTRMPTLPIPSSAWIACRRH